MLCAGWTVGARRRRFRALCTKARPCSAPRSLLTNQRPNFDGNGAEVVMTVGNNGRQTLAGDARRRRALEFTP